VDYPQAGEEPASTLRGSKVKTRTPRGHRGRVSLEAVALFVGEVIGFFTRTVRAVRLLARDGRIPKPLRVLAGIGLLPIPGPLDEAVLVVLAPVFLVFYQGPMREAWEQSAC
jgi:hypothetical protein